MDKITPVEIKSLFALARLPFDEKRVVSALKDMEEILGYVGILSRADASSIAEVHGGTDFLNALRADECVPADAKVRDGVVRSFPRNEADLNRVPPILGK
jgi:aspartyl/glutamyl-tRNA(Asn/Gln) amidotransferase C subunit